MPAHGRRLPGPHERNGAEVNFAADAGEDPYRRDQCCAHEAHNQDLQVCSAVRAVHGVIYDNLAGFQLI